jgi:hypothetical protein
MGAADLRWATEVSVLTFDKATGRVVWEIPGRFNGSQLSLAVAGTARPGDGP